MSKTTDDTLTLRFLPPLQRKHTRNAAVTAQLNALSSLSRQAVLRRALETGPDRRLERETLVAVVRGFLRAGCENDADTVLLELVKRVGGAVAGTVGGWNGLTGEDKQDAKQQAVEILCEKVCDLELGGEFWECNFTTCFNRRLVSLWHSFTDNALLMTDTVVQTDDGETRDRLEQYADPANPFHNAELQDLVLLVSGGSAKKSQALFLKLNGFSDEDIAKKLGVTSRTLRNWTTEASRVWVRMEAEEREQEARK